NSVLLPAPFGPTTATSSPAPTPSETPRSTGTSSYATCRSRISSILQPLPAEIGLDDSGVARDRVGLAVGQHGAVVEHGEALDEAHHRLHRVLDDHDGDAELGQPTDQLDQLAHLVVREPRE